MAVTSYKLPTSVIQNGTGVNGWINPNNILLVDGDFTSTSDTTAELVVGTFNLNIPVDATIDNFTIKIKGYRGSFNTTLQLYAVDTTTGVTQSYPMAPFQGFDGTNTWYTLPSTLFSTTWDYNQANNIQLKLMVDGELHVDAIQINCAYTPAIVPVPPTPPTGQVVVDEFVQGIRFQLAQSMTADDLYLFAESFTLPDGTPIEYTDFYGEALITVDQGVFGLEENIRITDIEHDYNGTGLVRISIGTIDNRGLGFIYPYLGSVTRARAHDGTAEFVVSNSAPFYNRFLRRNQIGALVSAPISVYDESTLLTTAATTFVFEGSGVTVTVDGLDPQKMHVTIPGGGGSGTVESVTSSDTIIDVNNTDPANPVLSLDTVALATDNTFVTNLANNTTFINALTSNSTFQTNVNNFVTGGAGGAYFVDQSPDNGTYGSITGAINGSNTLFTVSQGEYVTGKLIVYLNGLAQLQGASDDWQETDPVNGEFSFNIAPLSGDIITAVYLTTASTIDNYTVKATVADTTPSYLDDKINIHSSDLSVTVTKTITNPGANEVIDYDLTVVTTGSTNALADQILGTVKEVSNQDNYYNCATSTLDGTENFLTNYAINTTQVYVSKYAKDTNTGVYYVTHNNNFNLDDTSGYTPIVVLGNYVYVFGLTGSNIRCVRLNKADLTSPTVMTIPAFAFGTVSAFTDGTNLFLVNVSGSVREYSVSGTTLTFVQTLTGAPTNSSSAFYDSGTIYFTDTSNNIKAYTISGTLLISGTSIQRTFNGLINNYQTPDLIGMFYTDTNTFNYVYEQRWIEATSAGGDTWSTAISKGFSRP